MRPGVLEPPKFALRLLRALARADDYSYAAGDFEQIYRSIAERQSTRSARSWLYLELIRSAPGFLLTTMYWSTVVLANSVKAALRNIVRRKGLSFGNIIGLAVAMSCCLFVILWAQYELSYDGFRSGSDRLYRILKHDTSRDSYTDHVAWPLATALRRDYPEFAAATATYSFKEFALRAENECIVSSGLVVDTSFFKVFDVLFVSGSSDLAFQDAQSIVLTTSTAEKLFSGENPVGKSLHIDWWGSWIPLRVTAVTADTPDNSQLAYAFLMPGRFIMTYGWNLDNWSDNSFQAYALLEPGVNPDQLKDKLSSTLGRYADGAEDQAIQLQLLTQAHLHHPSGGGDIYKIYVAVAVGLLVLIVACINSVNLATVQWLERTHELNVRKTIGASLPNLIGLCLVQSLITSLAAAVLAFVATGLLVPPIQHSLGIGFVPLQSLEVFVCLAALALVTGIVAGIYPVLTISNVLSSARQAPSIRLKGVSPRRVLVALQYAVSAAIIISALIMYDQFRHISAFDLGYEPENVIRFKLRGSFAENYQAVRLRLLDHPDVCGMTVANGSFTAAHNSTDVSNWDGCHSCDPVGIDLHCADYDYLGTFGIKLSQGEFFSREKAAEASRGIILNESACRAMGLDEPVGVTLDCMVTGERRRLTVRGVTEDFNVRSLHQEIAPLGIIYSESWVQYAYVKAAAGRLTEVLGFIRHSLSELAPDYPFDYHVLDNEVMQLYQSEDRSRFLLLSALVITLAIASWGLFSLVSYSLRLRAQEVAVRKVLGASTAQIARLLSKEYFALTVVGYVLAAPVAYFVMERWLQGFAYRVHTGPENFILAAAAIVLMVVITLGVRVLRSARVNPAEGIRHE